MDLPCSQSPVGDLLPEGWAQSEHPCPGLQGTSQHAVEPVLSLIPSGQGPPLVNQTLQDPQGLSCDAEVSWEVLALLNSFQTR